MLAEFIQMQIAELKQASQAAEKAWAEMERFWAEDDVFSDEYAKRKDEWFENTRKSLHLGHELRKSKIYLDHADL